MITPAMIAAARSKAPEGMLLLFRDEGTYLFPDPADAEKVRAAGIPTEFSPTDLVANLKRLLHEANFRIAVCEKPMPPPLDMADVTKMLDSMGESVPRLPKTKRTPPPAVGPASRRRFPYPK